MGNSVRSAAGESLFAPFDPQAARNPLEFCPSVLSCDFANVAGELDKCRRAKARWVHFDIMDGHFVPNITFGPPLLRRFADAAPDLFFDAHLMIENPMAFAEAFAEAGAHLLNIHIETTLRARRDLRVIRRLGMKTGLTIKPRTPVKEILPFLDEVDLVLVMTVEPGFGGQKLIPRTLNKVRELDLARRRDKLPFRLQVDGGIDPQTAPLAAAAGADALVAGSSVFKGGDVQGNLKALRESIAGNAARD
jgi:ribulose-phosphate 3-epimerase